MRTFTANLAARLASAQDTGIEPAMFITVFARHRTTHALTTFGFWTGDETITVQVETETGGLVSRTFIGGVNLSVTEIAYVGNLTDNAVNVGLSQLSPDVQSRVRGYTVRFAQCFIYGTSWVEGLLISEPQLLWVGVVDEAPVSTPEVDSEGSIVLGVRSEIMNQLMTRNSAKSSNSHQLRRQASDSFSQYSGIVETWKVQWYNKS